MGSLVRMLVGGSILLVLERVDGGRHDDDDADACATVCVCNGRMVVPALTLLQWCREKCKSVVYGS